MIEVVLFCRNEYIKVRFQLHFMLIFLLNLNIIKDRVQVLG